MKAPRFFVHASAATVEDMIDAGEHHGLVVEARGYRSPSGLGVYGSVEVVRAEKEDGET